jgi:hypothetical protein
MAHTSDSQFPPAGRRLRSQAWFDNPENPAMTALYLERYLNDGITLAELTSASRSSALRRPALIFAAGSQRR